VKNYKFQNCIFKLNLVIRILPIYRIWTTGQDRYLSTNAIVFSLLPCEFEMMKGIAL